MDRCSLLPVVLVDTASADSWPRACASHLRELRRVSPVVGVQRGTRDNTADLPVQFDACITALPRVDIDDLSDIAGRQWRERLVDVFELRMHGAYIGRVLQHCRDAEHLPRSVQEVSRAVGCSREHLTRHVRAECIDSPFGIKRIIDACLVMDVLVRVALGASATAAAARNGIEHRQFLRSRRRLERVLPGPVDNFRVLMMQIEVVLDA